MQYAILSTLTLMACTTASTPSAVVRDVLSDQGALFDDHGYARWAEPDVPVEIIEHTTPCRIILRTRGWAGLDEAAGIGGVARLLTEIAARNAETAGARFGLRVNTGAVEVDTTLYCADGLNKQAVYDAVTDFHKAISTIRAPMRKAATLAPL